MVSLLKKTVDGFLADDCFRAAAALAYHAVFAIGPLLVLIITIAGLVTDPEQVSGEIERHISDVIGKEGAQQIRMMIRQLQTAPASVQGAVLSTVAILLGATGFLAELQTALNTAWDVPAGGRMSIGSLILKRLLQLLMILAIALVLLASVLLSAGISLVMGAAGDWAGKEASAVLLMVLHFVATLVVHLLLFSAVFCFMPDVKVAWRHALAGGAFTALCFMIGRYAIGTYLASQNVALAYGAAGSLVLVLVWVYYSTLILLLGAEFTHAWSQRDLERSRGSD
jgi:membrane protein